MITDFNMHIGVWPEQHVNVGSNDLLSLMDASGIQRGVVSDIGVLSGSTGIDCESDRLMRIQGVSPDTDLTKLAGSGRVHGLRIYPTYQPWDFNSDRWNEVISLAENWGCFLQVYLRFRDPRVLAQTVSSAEVLESLTGIIEEHNSVRFVVSGANLYEIQGNETLMKSENVWVDTAHLQHPMNSLVKLLDTIGDERVLFGSNAPFYYPHSEVFRVMSSGLSESRLNCILWQNAAELLVI